MSSLTKYIIPHRNTSTTIFVSLYHLVINSYLNKKQACEYLGISNNTLDSWIKQGLPSIKIGKTVRFNKQSIDAWLLAQN